MPRQPNSPASPAYVIVTLLVTAIFCCSVTRADEPPALWLYCPTNLAVKENVDKLADLWKRAAAAGYTHIMLSDSKFAHLTNVPDSYFGNCKRIKQMASDLKLELVPALFSIGYSNDLLHNDPNLAEGVPVRDAPFVVKDNVARIASDSPIKLTKPGFHDPTVKIDGATATATGAGEHHRFVYELPLTPYRCYHVSVSIKTQDFKGEPQINPLGEDGNPLSYTHIHAEPTQDWKQYDIVFDTLANKKVNLYFGMWGQIKGTLWWKDWKVEEAGLVNVLRRDGTPVTLTSEDGKTIYQEGNDYDTIVDPKTGMVPYAGEYETWHAAPDVHTHGLADGTRLKVSWYYPPIIYDGQVSACISEPKTNALLKDQASRMKALWGAKGYVMSHDEFRCCGQDEACAQRKLTPGQMLADNIHLCRELLRPQTAYAWSDMFDPFHNAVKGPYYLVNGSWTGSWEKLDRDIVIMNWNYGKRDESLKFFADRGNPQILAGFYDADLSDWKNWLDSASHVKNVVGYMYTTWNNDYSKVEDFARMSRQH